jgi:hypothetical protein
MYVCMCVCVRMHMFLPTFNSQILAALETMRVIVRVKIE